MSIETSNKSSFGFLPLGYRREWAAKGRLSSKEAVELFEHCVTQLLPERVRTSESLTDLKGRDPQELLIETFQSNQKPRREEIFYVAGTISPASEGGDEVEPLSSPFSFTISSAFEAFEGSHHIRHSVTRESHGLDDPVANPILIAAMPGLELQSYRVGLEYFESKFVSLFGYSPVVTQTLLLDYHEGNLACKIACEGLRSKEQEILTWDSTLSNLRKAFSKWNVIAG